MMDSADQTTQVIVWDRGRPARNAPQARNLSKVISKTIFALRAHCGRDARGPSNHLTVSLPWR
jgi:hypothetical protein